METLNTPGDMPPFPQQNVMQPSQASAPGVPIVQPPAPKPKRSKPFTHTLGFKVGFIVLLSLLLLIPTLMIDSLSSDRQATAAEAQREISEKWGLPQHVTGPVIAIPYVTKNKKDSNDQRHMVYILPKKLDINADVKSKTLYRSIYETVVYNTGIDFSGTFAIKGLLPSEIDSTMLQLDKAFIEVGITDLRGISKKLVLDLNGNTIDVNDGGKDGNLHGEDDYEYSSSVDDADAVDLSIGASEEMAVEEAAVPYDDMFDKNGGPVAKASLDISSMSSLDTIPFKMHLDLKGSDNLNFTPIGETTHINIKGDCPKPSFGGNFLPDERKVTDNGFTASWNIISINRTYPQAFIDDRSYDLGKSQVQVGLMVPVDSFQKVERAIKYAFLVIVLTFIAVLFVEIKMQRYINVFQYLLVGLALVLFYSLLLSISEHMAFGWAYLIAAAMTIVMITLYLLGILKSKKMALAIGAMLTIVYAYIFVLLNLESYALLAGSLGLFVVLSAIMYYSLKLKTEDVV
ncbi:MAG: cell envelope integrity protein CreD [Muribaculaceae bacterium]|nr:cell envelope integrity protein CreD [Muribaculaceae bacterium]